MLKTTLKIAIQIINNNFLSHEIIDIKLFPLFVINHFPEINVFFPTLSFPIDFLQESSFPIYEIDIATETIIRNYNKILLNIRDSP